MFKKNNTLVKNILMKKIILFLLILISSQLSGQSKQFMLPNEDFFSDRKSFDSIPLDEYNWLNIIKKQLTLDKSDSTEKLLMDVIQIHRFSYLMKYEIAKLLVDKRQKKEIYQFLLYNLDMVKCKDVLNEVPDCQYPVIDAITLDSSLSNLVLQDLIDNKNQLLCDKYSSNLFDFYSITSKLIRASNFDFNNYKSSKCSLNESNCLINFQKKYNLKY